MYILDTPDYHALFSRIGTIIADIRESEHLFLAPDELEQWNRFRLAAQRDGWLASRICMKTLARHPDGDPRSPAWTAMSVQSRNSNGQGVRPTLRIHGQIIDRQFSLSHSDHAVLAVTSKQKRRRIGCDLVPRGSFADRSGKRSPESAIPPRSTTDDRPPFSRYRMIFRPEEIEMIGAANSAAGETADRIWAVKEAAYKAINEDRPFSPLQWAVERIEGDAFSCRSVKSPSIAPVAVSTQLHDDHILAVAIE